MYYNKETCERLFVPEAVFKGDCYICGGPNDPYRSCGITAEDAEMQYETNLLEDRNILVVD